MNYFELLLVVLLVLVLVMTLVSLFCCKSFLSFLCIFFGLVDAAVAFCMACAFYLTTIPCETALANSACKFVIVQDVYEKDNKIYYKDVCKDKLMCVDSKCAEIDSDTPTIMYKYEVIQYVGYKDCFVKKSVVSDMFVFR